MLQNLYCGYHPFMVIPLFLMNNGVLSQKVKLVFIETKKPRKAFVIAVRSMKRKLLHTQGGKSI